MTQQWPDVRVAAPPSFPAEASSIYSVQIASAEDGGEGQRTAD